MTMVAACDVSRLTFRSEPHVYVYDGRELISVTQALVEAGLIDTRWFTEDACLRGTAVHQAIASHAAGELDIAHLAPALRPYFDGYLKFLAEYGCEVLGSEERVCDPALGYAGTLDLRIRPRGVTGTSTVVDVKTGTVPATVGAQTAAYARCLDGFHLRAVLNLPGDGSYRYTVLNNRDDLAVFLAALKVAQFKRAHR